MNKILFDTHCHTNFSTDSTTPPLSQVQKALEIGLQGLCFTDHIDYDFPLDQYPESKKQPLFVFNINDYFLQMEKSKKDIMDGFQDFNIFIGVECGLQKKESTILKNKELVKHPFDQIIGSLHLVDGKDPYYTSFWEDVQPHKCIKKYFELLYENITKFNDFDTLGHMDYIVRYAPEYHIYNPDDYQEIIETILKYIIDKNIALEINTSGFKNTNYFNPHPDIVKKYVSLGGKMFTIGSDAHSPEYLAYKFDNVYKFLKSINIKSYFTFKKRKPIEHSIV